MLQISEFKARRCIGLRPNSNDYVFYVIYVRVQNVAIYMLKHYFI